MLMLIHQVLVEFIEGDFYSIYFLLLLKAVRTLQTAFFIPLHKNSGNNEQIENLI